MSQSTASVYPFPASATPERERPAVGDAVVAQELAALRKELAGLQRELHELNAIQSPLVGIERVALYFGKSQDTIRRWVKDRVISCYKIPNNKGYSLLFSFKQIESDLEDYQQERY
ncbi:helix-turn-helix domain-containing protein [Ruficoccus amylovorans]|uniref:Helix-turn-helix domain-containing protein n=1 Tax=Ruficoccus amylovorans TaxID=1804625 RepID=A0A842HAW7_9BACT|nr:helix-turn-helix domain-containing protein [Ruficoccus amylovorans]MBC2592866.1 helix-turn-helix domain-containing protein [Ruficoccus amylovorans]